MTIFFDIDDTLVDSDSAHETAIVTLIHKYLFKIDSQEQAVRRWLGLLEKYLPLFFENKIGLAEQRTLRIYEFWQMYGKTITREEAMQIYQEYHQIFLRSCIAFPEAIATLSRLNAIYPLGIISNGTYSDQLFKLQNNNLLHFFEYVVISEKVNFSKPKKEIFEFACDQAKVKPTNAVYIGNSYEVDFIGAKNAGMGAIWLNRPAAVIGQAESIHSLSQVDSHLLFKLM